jgi:AbiV family abortive infection protein
MKKNDTYITGFKLIFENAKRLYNAAEILAEKKEYAIANSLLVLCAEEAMKAHTVITQHFFPQEILDSFNKNFEDHKTKLESIRGIIMFLQLTNKMHEFIYDPLIENAINHKKEDIKRIKAEGIQKFVDWTNNIVDAKNTDLDEENNWWKQANTLKQNGFYVGLNKGNKQWIVPTSITKNRYVKTHKYVSNFLQQIEVIYNLNLENEDVNKMVRLFKLKFAKAKAGKKV